jgi:UDP-glucose 4-epimerase
MIGSIGANTDWDEALKGVDAVVHLAARVHQRNDRGAERLYQEVNAEGTLHLARRAAAAGARHFIFASTVLVYGRSNDGRPAFKEDDALTPLGFYGSSKAEAEAGLKSLAQQHQMGITVVRPPLVYGLGAKGNFASLVKAVKIGLPLPLAAIRNQRAFVSVQNLSSFIAFCLERSMSGFEVFLVADNEQVSTPEFIRRLAKAAGTRAKLFPMPSPLLSGLLGLAGLSSARESLIGSLQLDITKAHATGWQPPLSLDEGLQLALHGTDTN